MTNVVAPPPKRWRRRLILITLVFGVAGAIVAVNSGSRQPGPDLPDPNGYDDLVRAGTLFKGEWPNKGDLDRADPSTLRPIVDANRAALDLARVGLARECLVHFEDTQEGLTREFEGQSRLKEVARLLRAEGIVAEADGRPADAYRSYRDAMNVGQALTQGGMLMDAQLGWVIQKQGSNRLRKIRDRLSKDELMAILDDLQSLDRRRVPIGPIVARWERWYRGAFNPLQRVPLSLSGTEATERITQQVQARKAHDQAARSLRFLMVEMAIHAYHEDRKAWPRSVADLVPGYLTSVPIDPSTGRPIDYPANPSGELTNDLDAIARPDGEVAPRP